MVLVKKTEAVCNGLDRLMSVLKHLTRPLYFHGGIEVKG